MALLQSKVTSLNYSSLWWWRTALEQDLTNLALQISHHVSNFKVEHTARLMNMVLDECDPLVFSSMQYRFYAALRRHGAFMSVTDSATVHGATAALAPRTCGVVRLRLIGASFDGETAVGVSVVSLVSGICRLLASSDLAQQLEGLAELPKAVCRALMFFTMDDSLSSGEFVLRRWLASRFVTPHNEEMLSWLGPRASLLQTPDVLDLVYIVQEMPDMSDVPALNSLLAVRHERLMQNQALAFDTTLALQQRLRTHVEARDILTYYAYFMHCMHMYIMLETAPIGSATPAGLSNLNACLADIGSLFEASVAMLLGIVDPLTCSLLSRLSPARLEHLRLITETFRDFLIEPQLTPGRTYSIINTIFNRTINFTSDYSSVVQVQHVMIADENLALFREPTYAPVSCDDLQTFYDSLHSNLQVIALHKLHTALPSLLMSGGVVDPKYCVVRMPANVNLHCVDWSVRFYLKALQDLPALCGAHLDLPHVGMDKDSIFIVGRHYTLSTLQVIMAAHCMRFNQFIKTAPMYPLLLHFYTMTCTDRCSPGELALSNTLALNTVLNTVAFWLGIKRRSILYSEDVPTPAQTEAFNMTTKNMHVIADCLANDKGELGEDARHALTGFIAMGGAHWIHLDELGHLCTEVGALPHMRTTDDCRLLRAMHEYHKTSAVYTTASNKSSASSGGGRPSRCVELALQGDEIPLAVVMSNVATISETARKQSGPIAHMFINCRSDDDYMARANAAIYTCILALPTPRMRHYLMRMHTCHTSSRSTKKYKTQPLLYVSAGDVVKTWSSAGRPSLCESSYKIRPAMHGANIERFAAMLEKLEMMVSVRDPAARDTPAKDPSAAQCLNNFYCARETGAASKLSVPVSVYMYSDDPQKQQQQQMQRERRLAMFGGSICLVNLSMDKNATNTKEIASAHLNRSTFGIGAAKAPSMCLNAVGAIYSLYADTGCDNPALRSKTYEHVKSYTLALDSNQKQAVASHK